MAEEKSRADKRYGGKEDKAEPKREPERKEPMEPKSEPKGESKGNGADDHMDMRKAMVKRHEREARELHGQHRDAMRDMHGRHEAEMGAMNQQMMQPGPAAGAEAPTPEPGE